MNSETAPQPQTASQGRRRARRTLGVMGLVLVCAGGVVGWVNRPVNVFEKMMWHEWIWGAKPGREINGPYRNSTCGPDLWMGYRAQVILHRYDPDVSVLIFADLENEGNFCQTSWEKSLSPVRMHVRYEETVSPGLELMWRAVYYRSSRELHLSVEVDESEEDISDLGEYLVEHGVSLDYVRNRMDSVLNEVVFPDFVSGFPGMKYSADDWGKVTVIREGLLS